MSCFKWFLVLLILSSSLVAGDWPQILGPNRNGIAASDEKLSGEWPKSGPQLKWEKEVGHAYAGIAAQGTTAILFHRVGQEEVVEALSTADGSTLWKDSYPTTFYPQVGGGDGPLCVPTIVGDAVVTYGAQGVLTCIDLKTGKRRWQRDTHRDFGAQEGYFGAGSAPIVVKDKVVVNVGGSRENAGIVAFDLKSGETIWKKTREPASYAAPTIATIAEYPHVLMITRYECMLLDPDTGVTRFQFKFGQRGPTVNGATPIITDDHLFVTSAYGVGSVYAAFNILEYKAEWETDKIGSQYCTPILYNDRLYLIDGRDDIPPADFKCIELATGKLLGIQHNFGYGTLIMADGKFIIAKTNGELILAKPLENDINVISRHDAFRGTLRALPALSNGQLYVRDENTLKCFQVGP